MLSIRPNIVRVLGKKHGLLLKKEAIDYLEEVLSLSTACNTKQDLISTLDYIASAYINHQDGNTLVDQTTLEQVLTIAFSKRNVTDLDESSASPSDTGVSARAYFHPIDSFSIPPVRFLPEDRIFASFPLGHKSTVLGGSNDRSSMFQERYHILLQRLLRNNMFAPSGGSGGKRGLHITPIKNLSGQSPGHFLLFGMLVQMTEDQYHLEDLDGSISLKFSPDTVRSRGCFTLNSFVLVRGKLMDTRVFEVEMLGMPPPESKRKSLAAFGHDVNFFGAPKETDDMATIQSVEMSAKNAAIVILSDVWLDQPKVLAKLELLFRGYSEYLLPLAFIFMGNFTSSPYIYNETDSGKYKQCFDRLADLITSFKELSRTSQFLFLPGPTDPWGTCVSPSPKIPSFFNSRMSSKIPHCHFMSNPCRIRYCTQDIVVYRQDLLHTMRRNVIVATDETMAIPMEHHLVSSLLDQAYLCPLPLHVRPVYWAFDHAMRIYPQPDVLVLGDKCDIYSAEYEECLAFNPGSFSTTFTFMVYRPSTRKCEESCIPDAS